MAFDLAFVDSIVAAPTYRLNLNDAAQINTLAEGTEFGLPQLDRAYASTLLTDGAIVPASAYSNRLITLNLDLLGATEDARATALQLITRELDRPSNVLRYKPGTTQPVFFRTLRSAASSVIWDAVTHRATVSILAEPFAYGTKQTLSVATVNNDPAAGSNGMFFDVSSPLGDVETPLFMSIDANDVEHSPQYMSAIGIRRRGTVASVPFVLQAEDMNMGVDTTVQANDAVMSGAGSNYTRTTFATASMVVRLDESHPAAADDDVRGTYRVFMRYRKSVAGDVVTVQLRAGSAGLSVVSDTYTLQASALRLWQDLGLLQYPLGADPNTDGYSGTALSCDGITVAVYAQRVSGSGNLDIDTLIFVPADDKFALVKWPESTAATAHIVDPAGSRVYGVGASGEVTTTEFSEIAGGLPYITPGVTNRIYFVLNAGGLFAADTKTETVDITPYYWPRYISVRPVSS